MRRAGIIGAMIGAASLSLGMASAPRRHDPDFDNDILADGDFGGLSAIEPEPKRKPLPQSFRRGPVDRGSIAQANRRGGEHQHSREIQRRMRQAARRAAKEAK